MKEVILNDKCAHCNHKECHDGEHFCKQAMKEDSFYKNANLYKGLEVIQRPTYEELEKENAELKEKFLTIKKDDVRKAKLNECKTYEEKVEYLRQVTNYALFNDDVSVMLWCFCQRGEIDVEQLTKAKELLKQWLQTSKASGCDNINIVTDTKQFLKEVEK